jgi:hypothetical protein
VVKTFFEDVRKHQSLADPNTRSWLGHLPFYMRKDAIPLFAEEGDAESDSTDYQLHPHYTLLEFGKTATQPDDNILQISIDSTTNQHPIHAIGVGRLFVNANNGKGQRFSKWTGYEVFVDWDLALWMVFDRRSLNPRAEGWYPESCPLSHPNLQQSSDESKEQLFDIACFFPSLCDLKDAKFNTASERVQRRLSGKSIEYVERRVVAKLVKGKFLPQEVELAVISKHLSSTTDGHC